MVSMIVALQHPTDATWYFSVVMTWSCTEISTAIIALSLPALRAFFWFLRNTGRSTRDQNTSNGSGSFGLRVVARSSKRRVFDGPGVYETTVDVDGGRSISQEALCNAVDGREIRVMDTVQVDVDSPKS